MEVHPIHYHVWDFAGMDGLQAAIGLFSIKVTHLAPFQSFTAEFNQRPCAVLRLCENNFRVVVLDESIGIQEAIAQLNLKVWVKRCDRMATLCIAPEAGLERIVQIATTKPIYTLSPFPINRAVPARIADRAILAWHHQWQQHPILAIQSAIHDYEAIQTAFGIPHSKSPLKNGV